MLTVQQVEKSTPDVRQQNPSILKILYGVAPKLCIYETQMYFLFKFGTQLVPAKDLILKTN